MPKKFSRNTRRAIIASLIGLAASGTVMASAASLSVTPRTLGAGEAVVASCDTAGGVTLAYTNVYQATGGLAGRYATTAVTVSGIDAGCIGKRLDITLKDATSNALGSGTVASVAGASETVTFTAPADAALVVGAAVVISD